jgi:small subunit ribosomal protein S30
VASLTAKSQAARQRRVERWQAAVHAAPSVDEKLRILTKMQFMKYVVYPQTFALNADRWYQGFTKTVFLSGLPAPAAVPVPAPGLDMAALRAAACDCLLQERLYLRRPRRPPLLQEREALASPFLDQLVAALTSLLGPLNPVLATAALGELRDPRPAREVGSQGPQHRRFAATPASSLCSSPSAPSWGRLSGNP